MPIVVECPNPDCGGRFNVPEKLAGRTIKCPKCGEGMYVEDIPAGIEVDGPVPPQGGPSPDGGGERRCPNCKAVLGADDVFCTECGTDLRTGDSVAPTGAPKSKGKTRKGAPLVVGGMLAIGLVVLVVLALGAGMMLKKLGVWGNKPTPPQQPQQPVAQNGEDDDGDRPRPPDDGRPENGDRPKPDPGEVALPKFAVPAEELAALEAREKPVQAATDGYIEKLKEILRHVQTSPAEDMAARWAQLYVYCRDSGLQTEAERCWYRAVLLRPTDPQTNQVLGRTETFADLPVTPQQKAFLKTLTPRLRVRNLDPELAGDDIIARTEAGQNVHVPLGRTVEVPATAGTVTLSVVKLPGRELRNIVLPVAAGTDVLIELLPFSAVPDAPNNFFSSLRRLMTDDRRRRAGRIEKDENGQVVRAVCMGTVITGDPIRIAKDPRVQGRWQMVGDITVGDPASFDGQMVVAGTENCPIIWNEPRNRREETRLHGGTHYILHRHIGEPLWRVLGTAEGHLAALWARSRYAERLETLESEQIDLEASGQMAGPWQGMIRASEEIAAMRPQVDGTLALQDRAAALPDCRDRARLLAPDDAAAHVYLNWPRFVPALSAALGNDPATLLNIIESFASGEDEDMDRGGEGFPSSAETGVQSAFLPSHVPTRSSTGMTARILSLLPAEAALAVAERDWETYRGPELTAALVSLERTATPDIVTFLAKQYSESKDTRARIEIVLSLGSIGTPQAIETASPLLAISPEVETASIAARAAAGVSDALNDALPEFIKQQEDPQECLRVVNYLSELDTPASLLALGIVADNSSDKGVLSAVAEALVRTGGHSAMRELARVFAKRGGFIPGLLAQIDQSEALMLLRPVGTAMAEGRSSREAADFLLAEGSSAASAFVKAAALNQKDTRALSALLDHGTRESIDAAMPAVRILSPSIMAHARKAWYSSADEGAVTWNPGIDAPAVTGLLEAALADDGAPVEVRLAAASMLLETGRTPDAETLLTLARKEEMSADPGAEERSDPRGMEHYVPGGFVEPDGRPRLPDGDFKLEDEPQFYALGILVGTGSPDAGAGIRKLLDTYDDARLIDAAMRALGQIGGEENLTLLRERATTKKDKHDNTEAFLKEFALRLAALDGLGVAHDQQMLPPILDMLSEAPLPGDAITGQREDYDELMKWWQARLQTAVCDCLAEICRWQSPAQINPAHSELQRQLYTRLIELRLLAEAGPEWQRMSELHERRRTAALLAFGRVADVNDPNTALLMTRLTPNALSYSSRTRGRGRSRSRVRTISGFSAAVLDAYAHIAARKGDGSYVDEGLRKLIENDAATDFWGDVVLDLAARPMPQYMGFLADSFHLIGGRKQESIVMRLKESPGVQQDSLAGLVAHIARRKPNWTVPKVERQQRGFAGVHEMEMGNREASYDRKGMRRVEEWTYDTEHIDTSAARLKERWVWIDWLFRFDGAAVSAALADGKLFRCQDIGPAVAVKYVALVPAAGPARVKDLTDVVLEARRVNMGPEESRGASYEGRSAVAALRRMESPPALAALEEALVGPHVEVNPEEERYQASGEGSGERALGLCVARTLGSLGDATFLRRTVETTQTDREFLRNDPISVQILAMHGMTYLPGNGDPFAVLRPFRSRFQGTPELETACVQAMVQAARRRQAAP